MKHNLKTGLKHYILEGAATERILQYSMDIVNVFGLDNVRVEGFSKLTEAYQNVTVSDRGRIFC